MVTRDKDDKVEKELCRLRNLPADDPTIIQELQEIKDAVEVERESKNTRWSEVIVPSNLKRLFIGIWLQIFQQWTGTNAVVSCGGLAVERNWYLEKEFNICLLDRTTMHLTFSSPLVLRQKTRISSPPVYMVKE